MEMRSQIRKKFEKVLKKDLTNDLKCGIINKSSARGQLLKDDTAS